MRTTLACGIYLAAIFSVSLLYAQPPQTRPGAGGSPPNSAQAESADSAAQEISPQDWPKTRSPSAERYSNRQRRGPARELGARLIRPPARPKWFLGVHTSRAPKGLRVDDVVFGSPAHHVGLERGDYILDVGGYVVGEYEGVYYPLELAMQYGADSNGWAELLVWNVRTFAEETVWVQLRRR
jgi:hypothetical protein